MKHQLSTARGRFAQLAEEQKLSAGIANAGIKLDRIIVRDGLAGAILRGLPGAGKSEVIESFVKLIKKDWDILTVNGSSYAKDIDYGALQFLLAELDENELESAIAVYGTLKRRTTINGKPLLMILDRITLLDKKTISVIMQLALEGVLSTLFVMRPSEQIPEELSALKQSDQIGLVEIDELSFDEARRELESLSGTPVSTFAVAKILDSAECNREWFMALSKECLNQKILFIDSKTLIYAPKAIRLDGEILNIAMKYIEFLNPQQRKVMEIISVAREIGTNRFSLDAARVIDELFTFGLIQLDAVSRRLRLISSLLGETLASNLSVDQFSRLCEESVNANIVERSMFPNAERLESWIIQRRRYTETGRVGFGLIPHELNIQEQSRSTVFPFRFDTEIYAESQSTTSITPTLADQVVDCRRILQGNRLIEASALASAFSPYADSQEWHEASACERHEAVALSAEIEARLGNYQTVQDKLAWICTDSECSHMKPDHLELQDCSNATFRNVLTANFLIGDWRSCRELVAEDSQYRRLTAENYAIKCIFLNLFVALGGVEADSYDEFATAIPQFFEIGEYELLSLIQPFNSKEFSAKKLWSDPLFDPKYNGFGKMYALTWYGRFFSWVLSFSELSKKERIGRFLEISSISTQLDQPVITAIATTVSRILDLDDSLSVKPTDVLPTTGLLERMHQLDHAIVLGDNQKLATAMDGIISEGFAIFTSSIGHDFVQGLAPSQKRLLSRSTREVASRLKGPLQHQEELFAESDIRISLTKRELMIAAAAASGLSNAEIALRSGVSVRTVEGHLYQVYSKLDLSNRNELVKLSVLNHLGDEVNYD